MGSAIHTALRSALVSHMVLPPTQRLRLSLIFLPSECALITSLSTQRFCFFLNTLPLSVPSYLSSRKVSSHFYWFTTRRTKKKVVLWEPMEFQSVKRSLRSGVKIQLLHHILLLISLVSHHVSACYSAFLGGQGCGGICEFGDLIKIHFVGLRTPM